MALDRADVEHIASLARIGLNDEEVETFREQLSHIIEQFDVLTRLDTTGITDTGYASQLPLPSGVMRDDVAQDSLDPEEVLSNAPRREGGLFRVKAVLEE